MLSVRGNIYLSISLEPKGWWEVLTLMVQKWGKCQVLTLFPFGLRSQAS